MFVNLGRVPAGPAKPPDRIVPTVSLTAGASGHAVTHQRSRSSQEVSIDLDCPVHRLTTRECRTLPTGGLTTSPPVNEGLSMFSIPSTPGVYILVLRRMNSCNLPGATVIVSPGLDALMAAWRR